MKKMKKKARYVSPRILGTSALLMDLICASLLKFRIDVDPLENMNNPEDPDGSYNGETFYFES